MKLIRLSKGLRCCLDSFFVGISVLCCAMLLLLRVPGMEILGIAPNWFVIWVVAWSLPRSLWQSLWAAIALGLIQDGMTAPWPSHVLSLAVVAVITSKLQKNKYIQEDFVSVALVVFAMSLVSETVIALQHTLILPEQAGRIWLEHNKIALTSAILNSLWAPLLCYPLGKWWETLQKLEKYN